MGSTQSLDFVATPVLEPLDAVKDLAVMAQILIEEKKIMASLQGSDWFVQLEASWHDTNNIYLAIVSVALPFSLDYLIIRIDVLPYGHRERNYQM